MLHGSLGAGKPHWPSPPPAPRHANEVTFHGLMDSTGSANDHFRISRLRPGPELDSGRGSHSDRPVEMALGGPLERIDMGAKYDWVRVDRLPMGCARVAAALPTAATARPAATAPLLPFPYPIPPPCLTV